MSSELLVQPFEFRCKSGFKRNVVRLTITLAFNEGYGAIVSGNSGTMGPREKHYHQSKKRAFRILFVGAALGTAIAYAVLIPAMIKGQLPARMGWGFVLGIPLGAYGVLILGSLWASGLDLKRLRKLDEADAAE